MATLDDLFGGNKAAPQPKWNTVGETHVGVISGEPKVTQERDFKTSKGKFFVKDGSKWALKLAGEFDESLPHNPVNQIVVPVTLKNGDEATFYFTGQKKDALKDAMQESGIALEVGTTVGVKLLRTEPSSFGVDRKIYAVKLAQ